MGDEETVSRRELFTGWARGLRDGLAEWVLPELEQQAARLREAFEAPEFGGGAGVETPHPWRDLLEPQAEEEDS
ncbi:MAG TPA: hypothetical protein VE953_17255 [Terriglobales bacterium]|nr:hypothetical protein [Terriglobales bacterium]